MKQARAVMLLFLALVLGAEPVLAHVGRHDAFSIATGLLHPFSGIGHMAAMISVGLWSGMVQRDRVWVWPAVFVALMAAGALLGLAGLALPLVEPGIAVSVIVLGLLVAFGVPVPVAAGAVLVGLFAVLHGFAHGAEAPAGGWAPYIVGFAAATAILHAIGVALAFGIERWAGRVPLRAIGGAVAVLGLVILLR